MCDGANSLAAPRHSNFLLSHRYTAKMSVAAEERRNFSSLLVSLSFSSQLSSPRIYTRPAGRRACAHSWCSVCAARLSLRRGTDSGARARGASSCAPGQTAKRAPRSRFFTREVKHSCFSIKTGSSHKRCHLSV